MIIEHLEQCRRTLAAAHNALTYHKDIYDVVKAQCEARAIERMNGSAGKNEDERKRNLTLALAGDTVYQNALSNLRAAEADVRDAEAELEIARDQRRAEEWQVRMQLTTLLDAGLIGIDTR